MTKLILVWLIIALSWFSSIGTILLIGKERKAYTNEYATASILVSIVYTAILLFVIYG